VSDRIDTAGHWLFVPLVVFSASQVAAALGSVFLGIAAPSDAPLVFGPQAVGGALLAVATLDLARQLRVSTAGGYLCRPVRIGAVGATIFAFGWAWYIVAVRNEGWAWIAGATFGALTAVGYAVALWLVFSRLRPKSPATA
jgi:hypothetical protein